MTLISTEVWGNDSAKRNLVRNAAEKAELKYDELCMMSDKQLELMMKKHKILVTTTHCPKEDTCICMNVPSCSACMPSLCIIRTSSIGDVGII